MLNKVSLSHYWTLDSSRVVNGQCLSTKSMYNFLYEIHFLKILIYSSGRDKKIGDKEPYYNTKILIYSFTWAGLAAFFSSDII